MLVPFPGEARHVPGEYRIRPAAAAWEVAGCRALRRAVFCGEQALFDGDDTDALDAVAIPLAALACVAGIESEVVGTVRIHEDAPGVWSGSRLAVDRRVRRVAGIGTSLIRLAVGMARGRGCTVFTAHVQAANAPLFHALHWRTLAEVTLHGAPHHRMQAELAFYAPLPAGDIRLFPSARQAA